MSKIIRTISIIFTIVICLSVLFGCEGKDDPVETDAPETEEQQVVEKTTNEQANDAYIEFLNGRKIPVDKVTSYKPQIGELGGKKFDVKKYAIYDLNGSGVCELVTNGECGTYLFSYSEGNVEWICGVSSSYECEILKNGIVLLADMSWKKTDPRPDSVNCIFLEMVENKVTKIKGKTNTSETAAQCLYSENRTDDVKWYSLKNGQSTPIQESQILDVSYDKLPIGEKVTKLEDLYKLNIDSKHIYFLELFLKMDYETLDRKYPGNYGNNRFDYLFNKRGVKLGSEFEAWVDYIIDYKGEITSRPVLRFTVDIRESNLDTFPVGKNSFELTAGYETAISLAEVGRADYQSGEANPISDDYVALVSCWICLVGIDIPDSFETNDMNDMIEYVNFIEVYLRNLKPDKGYATRQELTEAFNKFFGFDGEQFINSYSKFMETPDGLIMQIPRGPYRNWMYYDYVETGDGYATIQFFADEGRLLKGPKIRYTFERKDGFLILKGSQHLENPETDTLVVSSDLNRKEELFTSTPEQQIEDGKIYYIPPTNQ